MNINNLPYLSAYKHRLQAASAISSSPVTVSSRRTTDVSEIKQQPLTPLDRLFNEILSFSAPPGAGGWIPHKTVGEAMFIEHTNLVYQKAYDTTRKLIMEQKQAAAKPVLNTTA